MQDYDLQDILSINLQRAVQISTDIALHILSSTSCRLPETMAGSFSALAGQNIISKSTADSLRNSVGLRNVIVHEYTAINWEIICHVIEKDIEVFYIFMREIQNWMQK